MVDMVVKRAELASTVARVLKLLREPHPLPAVVAARPA
jgi:hypothetical protein